MKKILLMAVLAVAAFTLVGCNKTELFKEKDLNNFTATRTATNCVDGANYTLAKDGSNYALTNASGETLYYIDYGTETYQYINNVTSDDEETEEDESSSYISSEVVDVDLSAITSSLLSIKEEDVEISGNVYSFKILKNNSLLSPFMDNIKLDEQTDLIEGYTRGLITLTSASITVENKVPKTLDFSLTYGGKAISVSYSFSKFGSTEVSVYEESYTNKDYASNLTDNSPIVTLNFVGYGKVQVQLFGSSDYSDADAVNYFIYLFKNGCYNKSVIDSEPSAAVYFGTTTKTIKKSITTDTSLDVKNTRGTLSMVVKTEDEDENEVYSSQLILNLSDNSTTFDANAYTPIGGVISGFSVLDALEGISAEEFASVKVRVSIKYNGYTYTQPTFE